MISLHFFHFPTRFSIFPCSSFHISLDIFSYFPARLFIVSVEIGNFSQFLTQRIGCPSVFGHIWPTFLESSVVMQICFQISIVYPPSALSASVCVVAVAGAGLSLQIQFSLKIRATLSSSSPGFFIASFCPASTPPPKG